MYFKMIACALRGGLFLEEAEGILSTNAFVRLLQNVFFSFAKRPESKLSNKLTTVYLSDSCNH